MASTRFLGIKKETTFKTYVAPDKYVRIISDSIEENPNRTPIDDASLPEFAEVTSDLWLFAGNTPMQPKPDDLGHFLLGALGGLTTTNDGGTPPAAYKHTFKRADTIPTYSGIVTVDDFARKMTSAFLNSLELEVAMGTGMERILHINPGWMVYKVEKWTGEIPTATFSTLKPLLATKATLKIGDVDKSSIVRALRLTIANGIPHSELFNFGSEYLSKVKKERFQVTGEIQIDDDGSAEYDRFVTGDTFDLKLDLLSGETTGSTVEGYQNYMLSLHLPKAIYERDVVFHADRRTRPTIGAPIRAYYDATATYSVKFDLVNKTATY